MQYVVRVGLAGVELRGGRERTLRVGVGGGDGSQGLVMLLLLLLLLLMLNTHMSQHGRLRTWDRQWA